MSKKRSTEFWLGVVLSVIVLCVAVIGYCQYRYQQANHRFDARLGNIVITPHSHIQQDLQALNRTANHWFYTQMGFVTLTLLLSVTVIVLVLLRRKARLVAVTEPVEAD